MPVWNPVTVTFSIVTSPQGLAAKASHVTPVSADVGPGPAIEWPFPSSVGCPKRTIGSCTFLVSVHVAVALSHVPIAAQSPPVSLLMMWSACAADVPRTLTHNAKRNRPIARLPMICPIP